MFVLCTYKYVFVHMHVYVQIYIVLQFKVLFLTVGHVQKNFKLLM